MLLLTRYFKKAFKNCLTATAAQFQKQVTQTNSIELVSTH